MDKVIKITCKGSASVPLDTLQNFQGNLKTLEKPALEKLKRSLLKYGFAFPVFVWGKEILDGHQRIFAAKDLIKSGYTIGKIPVAEIEADSKKEAGEKLLMLNSHYAKMTDEGLYEFLNDCDIDISGLTDDLELPDINLDDFLDWAGGDVKPVGLDEDPPAKNDDNDFVCCPKCGFEVKI